MKEVAPNLFIGDITDCEEHLIPNVVHACRNPCFCKKYGSNKPDPFSPDYLFIDDGNDLYLNMIDPDVPLFKLEMFAAFLRWMKKKQGEPVLIHCNKGQSRSVSLALLWMAQNEHHTQRKVSFKGSEN